MKITFCGSIAFIDHMSQVQSELVALGHDVKIPDKSEHNEYGDDISSAEFYKHKKQASDNETWIWDRARQAMKAHFTKIEWSDAIIVANYDKNDVPGYIGGNTLMEIGLALHLDKKIYLLNPIPDVPYHEEILAAQPMILNGKISKINNITS